MKTTGGKLFHAVGCTRPPDGPTTSARRHPAPSGYSTVAGRVNTIGTTVSPSSLQRSPRRGPTAVPSALGHTSAVDIAGLAIIDAGLIARRGRGGRGLLHVRLQELARRERRPLHRGWAASGRHGDDGEFELDGQRFVGPQFTFDEAVSFQIDCENQDEVDYYLEAAVRGRGGRAVWLAQGQVRPVLAGRADRDGGAVR